MNDINNPLEDIKVKEALRAENIKLKYRKSYNPKEINILDYTVIAALEKQTPKKVLYEVEDEQEKSGYQETCPNCHCFVFDDYCARCGQKLDWGDIK